MNRSVFFGFLAAALFCITLPSAARTAPPLYWHDAIVRALDVRDAYYAHLGFKGRPLRLITSSDGPEAMSSVPLRQADTTSSWYHLVKGAQRLQTAPQIADEHFTRALSLASGDPGALWVTFLELHELGRYELARTCLEHLEREALARGATSVEVVAHQLLALARARETPPDADRAYEWASRFRSSAFWPLHQKAWHALPGRPGRALGAAVAGLTALKSSWVPQLELAYLAHRWFRTAAALLIFLCLTAVSLKALPSALHPLAELYPVALAPWLRHALAIAGFLAIAAFGLYPFCILTAMLLWRPAGGRGRLALALSMALLVAAPLDMRLGDMLIGATHPAEPVQLYRRATREGYHTTLDATIAGYLSRHPDSHLAAVAAAVSRYKANDPEGAARHIHTAQRLRADDPVVLVVAGIIQYALGSYDNAAERFQRCMEQFPRYESAYYNQAQCRLASGHAVVGADLYKQAREVARTTRGGQNRVDVFLGSNDRYFSDSLPRLRQMMLPDYKAADFWLDIVPHNAGSWQSTARLWSPHFFGLGPLGSMALVAVVFMVTIGVTGSAGSPRVTRRLLQCSLCGMPMCRKCKAGRICVSCHNATENVSNTAVSAQIENRITNRTATIRYRLLAWADIVVPGTGLLISDRGSCWKAIVLVAAMACIFATYAWVFVSPTPFPSGLARPCSTGLFAAAALLHLALVALIAVRRFRNPNATGVGVWH